MNYKKYKNLVEAAAWKAARRAGLLQDIEDILQEAHLNALEVLGKYDSERSKVSTYLYSQTVFYIRNLANKKKRAPEQVALSTEFDLPVSAGYEYLLWFEYLRNDEKEVVNFALQTGQRKSAIFKHFARQFGHGRAKQVFEQIQKKLVEV